MDTLTRLVLFAAVLWVLGIIAILWSDYKKCEKQERSEELAEKEIERRLNEDYELELLKDKYQIVLYLQDATKIYLTPVGPKLEYWYNDTKHIVPSETLCNREVARSFKIGYFITANGSYLPTKSVSLVQVVKARKEE